MSASRGSEPSRMIAAAPWARSSTVDAIPASGSSWQR